MSTKNISAGIALLFCMTPVSASIIQPLINQDGGLNIGIVGKIDPDDSAVLKSIVQFARVNTLRIDMIGLDSPGGDWDEALKLSWIIFSARANTIVADGNKCNNACNILFNAGVSRYTGKRAQQSTTSINDLVPNSLRAKTFERFLTLYNTPEPVMTALMSQQGKASHWITVKEKAAYLKNKEVPPLKASVFTPTEENLDSAQVLYLNGLSYLTDIGVDEDMTMAQYYFREAAENGQPEAMHRLGVMYYNGVGVEADENMAREWWERAAEIGSYPSLNNLALAFDDIDNKDEVSAAIKMVNNPVVDRVTKGMLAWKVGEYYATGDGSIEHDHENIATSYYRLSALYGYPEGQRMYGQSLLTTLHTAEGRDWLTVACSVGEEESCRKLKRDEQSDS